MITPSTRTNETLKDLREELNAATINVDRKADIGSSEWPAAVEQRDAAHNAYVEALPTEVARLAGLAETDIELAAELLLMLFPSISTAGVCRVSLDRSELLTGLPQPAYDEDRITVSVGRALDDLAESFDVLVDRAKLTGDAKKTAADARIVLKNPVEWPHVWALIEAYGK